MAYWIPVDAERDNDVMWISANDLTTNIRGMAARHVLVISDSCYSGMITREGGLDLTMPRQQYLQRMNAGKSRTLMASGGNEPVADGGGSGHSVFAAALLRGLRQMPSEIFTSAELFHTYVQEAVAGNSAQAPEYDTIRDSGHDSGDFVFFRGTNSASVSSPPSIAPLSTATEMATGRPDPIAVELSFWESVKTSTDPEDFKEYLKNYPDGRFSGLARNKLRNFGGTPNKDSLEMVEPRVKPEAEPPTAATHLKQGDMLRHEKKYAEAEVEYRQAIRLDPKNAAIHDYLGIVLEVQGKSSEAEAEYLEAIRLDPNDAGPHRNLAKVLIDQRKYAEAEAECRESIRLDPNYWYAHEELGLALKRQERCGEAEAELRDAIRLDPNRPEAHNNLGVVLLLEGKRAEAEAEFKEAIRLDPNYSLAQRNLKKLMDRK
jgi:Flp pilus assembly protein TadD